MGLNTREHKTYLQVIADGSIRKQVPEGTEGCVRREYEDKDGNLQHKFELAFDDIDGMIGDITVNKGKFGDQLIVPIVDGNDVYHLALSTSSNFGEDLMKKMPNVDLTKPVRLAPFSFTADNGKEIRGIDVRQDWDNTPNSGTKIAGYYYDQEAKKNINGYPNPEGDTKTFNSDDWKVYFIGARKFLVSDLKDKGIIKDSVATLTPAVATKEILPEDTDDEWDELPKTADESASVEPEVKE